MYFQRLIEPRLQSLATQFKGLLLLGARQVGKSTVLRHLYPDIPYYVFDPIQDIFQVRNDPDLFLKSLKSPLIFDEVQYVPELIAALKRYMDEREEKGQFFLTGSQNFSVLKTVSESRAGRVGVLHLGGMTTFEFSNQLNQASWLKTWLEQDLEMFKKGSILSQDDIHGRIWRGSYPAVFDFSKDALPDYFSSYLQTYVERDIRILKNISNPQWFSRFVQIQAALTAQEINYNKISKDFGVAMTTIQSWSDLLKYTYLWKEIESFSANSVRRVIRRSKGYFADTGLACYLLRISTKEALLGHPLLGALFETLCVNEIKAMLESMSGNFPLYHWRTQGGAEVDLIIEYQGVLFPVEFKCSTLVSSFDLREINSFRKAYENTYKIGKGLVIYAGDHIATLSENDYAMPWNWSVASN